MNKSASVICFMLLALAALAQVNFPKDAKSLSCSSQFVSVIEAGAKEGHDQWESKGTVTTSDGSNFKFEVGQFPPTRKGRHAAEEACSKWMDAAEKALTKKKR